MSMGGGSTGTQTTTNEPWAGVRDDLNTIADTARFNAFNEGMAPGMNALPEYYPGQTYTNFDPATVQGMNMMTQAATQPGVTDAALQNATATMRGDYLNSNPYVDQMFNQAAGNVRGAIDSQFVGAGRYGSGAHQDVLGKNYNDLATNIYGGNYANERMNQMRSLALAPQMDALRFSDANAMMGVGAMNEGQVMKGIAEDINRYNFQQQAPWMELNNYAALVGGLPLAGYGTTSQPTYGGSPFAGAMGGAMTGATLGSVVPGIGTGIGAIGGALMGGLFS